MRSLLHQVACSILVFATLSSCTFKPADLYDSIDPTTFTRYGDIWNANHKSWISIDPNEKYCDPAFAWTSFPVCSGNYTIEEDYLYNAPDTVRCRRAHCIPLEDDCGITPRDTMDYLPPAPLSSLDTNNICSSGIFDQVVSNYTFGLDQGIPPEYTPIAPIGLKISGYINARFNGKCRPVANAEIIAWQLDAQQLSPLNEVDNKYYQRNQTRNNGDPYGPYTKIPEQRQESLRSLSCRGQQHSDESGFYSFLTTFPPSYGPPRHLMFTISAPGFQTITTRVYFDEDWRLQQLTTAHGNVHARTVHSPPQAHGFATDHKDYSTTAIYPGNIAKDPRVGKLQFRHQPIPSTVPATTVTTGLAYGHFEVQHSFYLAPLRSDHKNGFDAALQDQSMVPAYDITGTWSDTQGGKISVETHGNVFIAREVPHPRTWHVLWGYLVGNSIRGVQFQNNLQSVYDNMPILEDITVTLTERLQLPAYATGVIIPTDPFQSNSFAPNNPQAMTIQWSGGDMLENQLSWSKQSDRLDNSSGNRYRYLKLLIVRANGLDSQRLQGKNDAGQLKINEIEFFESILANERRPRAEQKLKSARFPAPFVVTCSSFLDQDHHCYKAFDGDVSSKSVWKTNAVGIRRNVLAEPQWVLFDFGAGHEIQPTALRIVCDAANTGDSTSESILLQNAQPSNLQLGEGKYTLKGASGCPMTFMLQGSHDNVKFDTLYRQDLYDYARNGSYLAEYPAGGRMFYFPYDSLHGRADGQRCGSCDTAPAFTCNRDSYDITCDSRYCGTDGRCAPLPTCPAGQYLHVSLPLAATTDAAGSSTTVSLYQAHVFQCLSCPPGRYGAVNGLTSIVCSGTCAPGYFCPAGSTSATQYACSDVDKDHPYAYYCPVGTGSPLRTPSGQRTILHPAQDRVVTCEAGAYCIQGIQYPCPVGKYGAVGSLATSDCSKPCPVGYYCSQTTDNPWINRPAVNQSDDQNTHRRHLTNSDIHVDDNDNRFAANYLGVGNVNPVVCPKGYYCPDGRYPIACPAGRYGNVTGLVDAYCAGACALGHYCPSASVSARQVMCPAGTYGNVTGLPNEKCAGVCPEGYFCPPRTVSPTSNLCGSAAVYCPAGSAAPVRVTPGFYTAPGIFGATYLNQSHQLPAERGFYAQYGRKFACPAGTYGAEMQLSADQIGQGDMTPTRAPSAQPSLFPTLKPTRHPTSRPSFTAAPTFTAVPTVFSSVSPTTASPSHSPTFAPTEAPTLSPTFAPSWMPSVAPSVAPTQPTFTPTYTPSQLPSSLPTSTPSLSDRPTCSPTRRPSAQPTLIYLRRIYTQKPTSAPTLTSQRVSTKFLCSGYCAPGFYCPETSVSSQQIPCPAGRYGDRSGLGDAYCAGVCPLGHYCPAGSVIPTPCPAGVFGAYLGLRDATCSNQCPQDENLLCDAQTSLCPAGYFCPTGTISAQQYACGSASVYCPPGSAQSVPVTDGYYSISNVLDRLRVNAEFTNAGYDSNNTQTTTTATTSMNDDNRSEMTSYKNDLLLTKSFRDYEDELIAGEREREKIRVAQTICEPGYFCVAGQRFACPAGRYGDRYGLTSAACSGICARGYYCPEHSVSAKQYPCVAGRYGSVLGMGNAACSGVCAPGFHCPPASTSPTQLACGILHRHYLSATDYLSQQQGRTHGSGSDNGNGSGNGSVTIPVDAFALRQQSYLGQFPVTVSEQLVTVYVYAPDDYEAVVHTGGLQPQDTRLQAALTSAAAATTTTTTTTNDNGMDDESRVKGVYTRMEMSSMIVQGNAVYCPLGSARPIPSMPGYYTTGGFNASTRTDILLCPVGSYCEPETGLKFACPAGRYGDKTGVVHAECSGACQRGYYCPAGSIVSTQNLCPIGRYGDREGLTNADCSGPCLHPLDCPAGSITSKPGRNV